MVSLLKFTFVIVVKSPFKMSSSVRSLRLSVQASAMSTVVDRFGGDVPVDAQDDGTARVCVRVMEAPTFYGWLATLGTQVSIEEPQPVREAYAAYLRSILALY